MTAVASRAVFELVDRDARSHDPVADGAWRVVEAPEEAVSFDASGHQPEEIPVVWRVRLDGLDGADAALSSEARHAEALDARLTTASERARAVISARRREEGVSFSASESAPSHVQSNAAERGLEDFLDGAVSFAADDEDAPPGGVAALLDNLWRRASRFARVETRIGQRDVASTDVTFLGEVTTTVCADATADEARLHRRAVETALATRRAWARIVIETLQVALLLVSGNALAALPAAWRFVRRVMAEVKELERLQAA